jgi:hypothetical protein
VHGERTRPFEIVPDVSVCVSDPVLMFTDKQPNELRVVVKGARAAVTGTLSLDLPPQYRADPAIVPFELKEKGDEAELRFRVRAEAGPATRAGALHAIAEVGGRRFSGCVTHIEYPHIPPQMLLFDAEVKLAPVDLKRAGTRIGYIAGAGDEVPASLRRVGYEVTMLSDEAIANAPLDRYDAIVVGIRAYNTNERMHFHHPKLMSYVAAGGTLVAQYSTNNRLSKVEAQIGPWSFEIARDRVTDENAVVSFDLPQHAILTTPNKIRAEDFEGWVQERGLYFAGKWDPQYQTPLSMHDAMEPARKGSVLFAKHKKGVFIYTGLAFFRQLPAGVPGAYRLFANMVARRH